MPPSDKRRRSIVMSDNESDAEEEGPKRPKAAREEAKEIPTDPDELDDYVHNKAKELWDLGKTNKERRELIYGETLVSLGGPVQEWIHERTREYFQEWGAYASEDEGEEGEEEEAASSDEGEEGSDEEYAGEEGSGEEGSDDEEEGGGENGDDDSEEEASFTSGEGDSGSESGDGDGDGNDWDFLAPNGTFLGDPGWKKMYDYFADGNGEPPGYEDHPDYHMPKGMSPNQLWASIRTKVAQPGFYAKYGVVAQERTIKGEQVRIVHRTQFGNRYKWNEHRKTGDYEQILLDVMLEIFPAQPFQPPFVPDDEYIPKPRYLDFEPHAHINKEASEAVIMFEESDHNMWCLCTQCSILPKRLDNLTAMRHVPSGIIFMVGGLCAAHIMGYQHLTSVTHDDLNKVVDGKKVGRLLGLWEGDDDDDD